MGRKERKKAGREKLVPTNKNKNKTNISLLNCHFNYKPKVIFKVYWDSPHAWPMIQGPSRSVAFAYGFGFS